jgi:hypothetical protein
LTKVFLDEGLTSGDARLSEGESYLIFVYKLEGNKIYTNYCSGTIKLKYAAEKLRLLGEGISPKMPKPQKRIIIKRPKK